VQLAASVRQWTTLGNMYGQWIYDVEIH
jgi:hypothetical protein